MTRQAFQDTASGTIGRTTSRYTVLEEPQGFRVEGGDGRCPVLIHLHPTFWSVRGQPEDDAYLYTYTYGLVSFRSLLNGIAGRLMETWNPPQGRTSTWGGIYAWAISRTSAAIGSRVYTQWRRLLATVPEDVLRVSRAVFAATFDSASGSLGCESWEELYSPKYEQLVADILNYRAAALACHNADSLIGNVAESLKIRREAIHPTPPFPGPAELRFGAVREPQGWYALDGMGGCHTERKQARTRQLVLDLLAEDWKALFAPQAAAYRSLNRTLMHLPGGLPSRLCNSFPFADLSRPMTDRVELLLVLLFCEQMARYSYPLQNGGYEQRPPSAHRAYRIFAKARREGILRALARLAAHQRQPALQTPTAASLNALVSFLVLYCASYPENAYPDTIVGLTERAIEQRNLDFHAELERRLAEIDPAARLSLPPIAAPDNPALRLLTTAGEVVEEGARMEHCIALYTSEAIEGSAYIYHVTYRQSEATALVYRDGVVAQCEGGPRGHRTNAASVYGFRALSRWGKALPKDTVGQENQEPPTPEGTWAEDSAFPF